MAINDAYNLTVVTSTEDVDLTNKKFYSRYNYPRQVSMLPVYPAGVAELFLNQDVGSFDHCRVARGPRIWVAGCGTNQALLTALKFPAATVLGTDVSTTSLRVCAANARSIGVTNLTLEDKSLNDVDYVDAFDYIICTGVVHHNAAPGETLSRIARALSRDGVLELMVYNYYHRLMSTACQRAIRAFYDANGSIDMDLELALIRQLIRSFPYDNLLGQFVKSRSATTEAEMADLLLQPVEYSYTVESLGQLAAAADLTYVTSCLNASDAERNAFTWNTRFADGALQARYDGLPDDKRWQITNLLMFNASPMLWFYFQRRDAASARKSEGEICEAFLESAYAPSSFNVKHYVLNTRGEYGLADGNTWSPRAGARDSNVARVLQAVRPGVTMRDIHRGLGIKTTFHVVNDLRLRTTTSAFPLLMATAA